MAAALPIRLILDRLLYASDASDARSSISQLQERIHINSASTAEEQQRDSDILELVGEHAFVSILCQLIVNSQLFGNNEDTAAGVVHRSPIFVEDGSVLACDFLLKLLASPQEEINLTRNSKRRTSVEYVAAKALLSPSLSTDTASSPPPADLVSSLVDVLTNKTASSHTTYERILSMKLLSRLFTLQPSMTQFSLIHRTPHGLNRLVDLLDVSEEERIRNELLILLITALSRSTSANTFRQMLLFAEGIDKALQIAVTSEDVGGCGGLLSKINELVILDCTTLIYSILQMGGAAPDILLGSTSSLRALTQLCDGRKGKQFLYKAYSSTTTADNNIQQKNASAHQDLSMEDLLSSNVSPSLSAPPGNLRTLTETTMSTPTLTKYEDLIVTSCLNIILFCISASEEDDDKNQVHWRKIMSRRNIIAGNGELMGIIKCWALYHPPSSPPCAFVACAPQEGTQKVALQILSTLCSRTNSDTTTKPLQQQDTISMICELVERHPPIYNPDTTTDDYFNHPISYKLLELTLKHSSLGIIALAISTLRSCLTEEQASIMVLHSLAPPPPSPEEEEVGPDLLPISPVQTLIDELASHLLSSCDEPFHTISTHSARKIQGSAGALGVILYVGGNACQEMLLKIPISFHSVDSEQKNNAHRPQYLLPLIASWLEKSNNSMENNAVVVTIRSSLIRLICDWCNNCHIVVTDGIFSSISDPMSMVKFLLTDQRDDQNITEMGLSALLLGLWMENIGDAEHAGWSRSILLNLVRSKIGLSSFTEILESAKEQMLSNNFASNNDVKSNPFWWSCNEEEQRYTYDWFLKSVNLVRRRLVHEITGICDSPDSGNDEGTPSNNRPFLSALVEQQTAEIEALRRSLKEASMSLSIATSECRQWRARCESSSFSDADAIAEQIEVAIKAQQEAIALREELDSKNNILSNLKNEQQAAEQNFQSKLHSLQQENDTIAQENEMMSQELQSLSQAYYNLENEIQLMRSHGADESHPQLVVDPSLTTNQSAIVSSDSSSQVEALQREVKNLRERLHAADDWMAMAVDRMNAMASENQNLVFHLQQNDHQVQSKSMENNTIQHVPGEFSSQVGSCTLLVDDIKPEKHALEEKAEILQDTKLEKHTLEGEVELQINENVKVQEWMSKALAFNQYLTQQNEELVIQVDALKGQIRVLEEEILDVKSNKERALDELKLELESELQIMKENLEDTCSSSKLREVIPDSSAFGNESVVHNYNEAHGEIIHPSAHHNKGESRMEKLNLKMREIKEQLLIVIAEKKNIEKKLALTESEVALLQGKLEATLPGSATDNSEADLQEELHSLRKSNVEAQEWMSNAVLHHEYLNGEIQDLYSKNLTLNKELESLRITMDNVTKSDEQWSKEVHDLATRNKALMKDITAQTYEKEKFIKDLKEVIDVDDEETFASLHDLKDCISLVQGMKEKLLHDTDSKFEVAALPCTEATGLVVSLKDQIFQHEQELELFRAERNYTSGNHNERVQDFQVEREGKVYSVEHHGDVLGDENSKIYLQEQIKDLEEKLSISDTQIKLLLESERSAKAESLAAADEVTAARTERARINKELQDVKDALAESKVRLAAMEELIEGKKSHLEAEEQKVEALYQEKCFLRENFENCQNSFNDLTIKLETMTNKFEESRKEVSALEERLKVEHEMRLTSENTISSLTESIRGYQDSLEMNQKELERFRREWEEDIIASKHLLADSQGKLLKLEAKLTQAQELQNDTLQKYNLESEYLQNQLHEKEESLNNTKKELLSLSTRFDELVEQSSAAVTQWKDRYEILEEAVKVLDRSSRDLVQNLEFTKQEQLNAANDAITQWEARCEELTHKIEEVGEQSSLVVNQWKERCEFLEATVEDLQRALQSLESDFQQLGRTKDEQLNSANDAITLWENRCAELTNKINDIQESYEISQAELLEGTMAELQDSINHLMASNDKLNSEINFVKDLLKSTEMERDLLQQQTLSERAAVENVYNQLSNNLIQSESIVTELQSQKEILSSALALAEEKLMKSSQTIESMQNRASLSDEEHRSFQRIISQLQNELREAYEALQTKVTDELTEKAFEKATQMLNSQLEQLRLKLKAGCDELMKEREWRLAAEHALNEVKNDLSFLFDPDGKFDGSEYEKLKAFASKATDCITKNERKVIEDLSIIIENTMKELSTCKFGEREAIERMEAAQLDLSAAEKEKESFKIRLLSMQRTADKAKGDYVTNMNLLRSRVLSLEDELSRSSRIHTEQINNLKKQVSQSTIEKDQLLRSLREVEGSYSSLALVRTNGKEESNCGEKEVAKLLIEKSELLFAMSDATSKTERRLRCLLSLQTSTHETELMIERELRQALETSLGEKEKELSRINEQMIEVKHLASEAEEKLKKETVCFKKEIQVLHSNIERLKSDFDKSTEDNSYLSEKVLSSSLSNQKLLDKYRKSEIEVRKLKEQRQCDADIASEIVRMKTECLRSSNSRNSPLSPRSALSIYHSEVFDHNLSVEGMYRLIFDLRQSVNEERNLHHNLMLEHEDLLAIFAHLDIERSQLQFALATVAGQSAVDEAIREAEKSAAVRYGGTISF